MKNPQLVLKIFVQYYFDIDWLYKKHLRCLLQAKDDVEESQKYLNMLDLIRQTTELSVTAKALLFLFRCCFVQMKSNDHAGYCSLLFSAHFLAKAERATKDGNQVAFDCWKRVAKGISLSINEEVILNATVARNYIQAELAEAKAAVVREREVRLWETKLEHIQGCARLKDSVIENIKLVAQVAWNDILIESYASRKSQWIKYCQRMSCQAKLEGDIHSSKDWETVVPFVWGVTDESDKDNSDKDLRSKTMLVLIARSFAKRIPDLTGKYWESIVDNLRRQDNVSGRLTSFMKQFIDFEEIFVYCRRLQKILRGRTNLRNFRNNSYGFVLQHQRDFLMDLLQLTKKAERCLTQYFISIKPRDILRNERNSTAFFSSYKAFTKLIFQIKALMKHTGSLFDYYQQYLTDSTESMDLSTELASDNKVIVIETSKLFNACIQCVDEQLTEYLLIKDYNNDGDRKIGFEFAVAHKKLELLTDTVQSITHITTWIQKKTNCNQSQSIEIIHRYGQLVFEGILTNPSLKGHNDHTSKDVLNLFQMTQIWIEDTRGKNKRMASEKEEIISKALIQLWMELQYLDLLPSKAHLAMNYVAQSTVPQIAWINAVQLLYKECFILRMYSIGETERRQFMYYMQSMTCARQEKPLLSALYLEVAATLVRDTKGYDTVNPGLVYDWFMKAIEAHDSNMMTLATIYKTAAHIQQFDGRDLERQLVNILRALPSLEEKIEWKEVAELCLENRTDYYEVIERYCARYNHLK